MPDESGFQIGKRLYPFPQRFRLGDPVLVEQLTGLTWMEFIDRLPDEDDPSLPDDPVANLGMIGVAVAQANPTWRRDRVVRFVQEQYMDAVRVVGPAVEEDDEESADPLAATNGSPTSERSAPESGSGSESPLDGSNQKTSGAPASAT